MTSEPSSLRGFRDQTIDDLCRRFAADELSMADLERRLEKARAARTRAELSALLDDLRPAQPAVSSTAPSRPPARARKQPPSRPGSIPEAATSARSSVPRGAPQLRQASSLAFAVMGGTRRAGRWVPPSTMSAVAIMGGVELDFRNAVFTGGVVEINCFAFWGGVEIIVPPDVHVDTHGFAVLGGFDQTAALDTAPAPDAPTIRINGFALMGAVEVKVAVREASDGSRGRGAGGARLERGRSWGLEG